MPTHKATGRSARDGFLSGLSELKQLGFEILTQPFNAPFSTQTGLLKSSKGLNYAHVPTVDRDLPRPYPPGYRFGRIVVFCVYGAGKPIGRIVGDVYSMIEVIEWDHTNEWHLIKPKLLSMATLGNLFTRYLSRHC